MASGSTGALPRSRVRAPGGRCVPQCCRWFSHVDPLPAPGRLRDLRRRRRWRTVHLPAPPLSQRALRAGQPLNRGAKEAREGVSEGFRSVDPGQPPSTPIATSGAASVPPVSRSNRWRHCGPGAGTQKLGQVRHGGSVSGASTAAAVGRASSMKSSNDPLPALRTSPWRGRKRQAGRVGRTNGRRSRARSPNGALALLADLLDLVRARSSSSGAQAARRLEAAESGPLFAGGGTWMRASRSARMTRHLHEDALRPRPRPRRETCPLCFPRSAANTRGRCAWWTPALCATAPMESASGLRPQEGRQTHDDDVLSPL